MPFDRGELLREAGYEEGDFIGLVSITQVGKQNRSTTSSSFQFANGLAAGVIPPVASLTGGGNLVVAILAEIQSDAGETGTVQMYDENNFTGVTTLDATGAAGDVWSGWVDVSLNSPGAPTHLTTRIKTTDTTDGSTFGDVTFLVGVEL